MIMVLGRFLFLYRHHDFARIERYSNQLSADDGRIKTRKIFRSFVDVGKEFDLGDTPGVKMLEEAINVCDRGASPTVAARLTGAEKFSQRYTRQTAPSFVVTLQGFVVQQINILEAICWIYTCCIHADEVRTDKEAELHLYQLLLIFRTLRNTTFRLQSLLRGVNHRITIP